MFRSSTGIVDDMEGTNNHVVESHSKGEVQEGQKFYDYKHLLKQAWGGGGGGGGGAPNPENQFIYGQAHENLARRFFFLFTPYQKKKKKRLAGELD